MKRRLIPVVIAFGGLLLASGTALAGLPAADTQSVSTDHAVAKTITLTGTADAGLADFTIASGPSHGGLDVSTGVATAMTCDAASPANCSGSVLYTPSSNYEGPDSFTFNVGNATDGTSGNATVSITVGSAPTVVDDPDASCSTNPPVNSGSYATLEDTPLTVLAAAPCGLLANDTDADAGDSLTASLNTNGSSGTATVGAAGGFTYTPTANANGADTFTYDASDGATTSTGTVHVAITPVNDAPSFVGGATVTVNEDSGAYSAGWATSISRGPADESGQVVDFQLTTDSNAGLFAVEPALAANGTLTFTPAANANGSATIGFKLHDDGGTDNDGVALSGEQTFTLNVTAVNDAPSFVAGSNPTVSEDSGAFSAPGWATASAGPSDESSQTVSFHVTSDDNASLFSSAPAVSASGALTFTPGANRNGVAHLTIVAQDTGGGTDTSAGASVTITVTAVNDPPNPSADSATVPENSAGQAINVLANDNSLPDGVEALTVTAVGSASFGTVTIAIDGRSVTYKPNPGYYGADFFTYTIQDPGGLPATSHVDVSVAKDVTPPAVSTPSQRIRTPSTMTGSLIPGRVLWLGVDTGVGISSFQVQRSVNGGVFTAVAISSPTATNLLVNYSFGSSYRYRVRAIDKNGNVSAWVTGPTFAPYRSQETSGYIKYAGIWTTSYSASDSSGAARYTTVAGRTATFTRSMRDVALVAPTSTAGGSARIYVDGVWITTISLKATSTHYQQAIWGWHFNSLGTHSIKVVVLGNGRVYVDAFVILG